ncbi:MAG: DNA translocase FtsK [Solobacterium sp.]|nr:DNA translocase FtsK [Solobacterium sp.]
MDVFIRYAASAREFFAEVPPEKAGGGLVGAFLYGCLSMLFGRIGVIVVIIAALIIAAILSVPLEIYKNAVHTLVEFFRTPEKEEPEETEEEEKEPANLWNMISEHRKKKLVAISADDPQDHTSAVTILTEKKKEEEKPQVKTLLNIRADEPTQEIQVVSIPGKVVSSKDSVFINVDELRREEMYSNPGYDDSDVEPEDAVEEEQIVPQVQPEAVQPAVGQAAEGALKKTAPPKKRSTKPYRLPVSGALLDPLPPRDANSINEEAAREKGELLIQILRNFDIEAKLIDTHIGPSVTQFEVKPDASVKISRILGLTDNIKMQLAAKDVRIEAPIPGRPAVGVEIPNVKSTPVKMRELIREQSDRDKNQPLMFFVGKDLLGECVTCRLDKMPHLLIAGATGSGKSVCMNSIITSLLLRTKPDEVKMLLVDPKKVEFTPYQNIPHLIAPVINDPAKASNALKIIVRIMDERYNIFSLSGVRNIEVYNEKVKAQNGAPNEDGSPAPKPMPYIVVIIDELADLMAVAGKEVEQSIQRITQLARAAGIHLIVATQRPSVDVITGLIKANIPSRIAFAVSSGTDSRTILDHVGAERLLGYGDMLYMPIGASSPMRVQGVFVTDEEVRRITEYVSAQAVPMYDDAFIVLEGVENGEAGIASVSEDPMFQEVKEYVIEAQKASTSLLQRRFGIGYNRAARMIDALEEHGVIGPAQGSKPREVYMKKE